jgi:hypothetical protein
MTEDDWLSCVEPFSLLNFLDKRRPGDTPPSARKLDLFAAACMRRSQSLWHDVRPRAFIEALERSADGPPNLEELFSAACSAWGSDETPSDNLLSEMLAILPLERAINCARFAANQKVSDCYEQSDVEGKNLAAAHLGVRKDQAILLREIFGNPFRPASIRTRWRAWNDGTVAKLAQGIHEERAYDRLPILGDALEDAGCGNADILNHCRRPGPHVRGCWVIDLLLGKE